MKTFREWMEVIGTGVDGIGVLIIVTGAVLATMRFIFTAQGVPARSYKLYRQSLGRAILLGLEFLVAGDIIRTVVVSPTLDNVIVLGIIVLIRTFLSMALELELGNIPWRQKSGQA